MGPVWQSFGVATYAENFQASIERARSDAIRLSAGSHTSRDLEKLVENVGADLELFLKTAVYGGRRRMGLKECICGLAEFGIEQTDIDALDEVRVAYNTAKHDPGSSLSFGEVDKLFENASTGTQALQAAGAGRINSPEPIQSTRQFWILAGDHLIGGETEIDICMPMPNVDFPPGLDIVNIDMAAWPQARQALSESGELREGPGSVPERVYQIWSNESDVAFIGSWTGSYRDLLLALLPFERTDQDLLPGLARGDDFSGALSAMLMSAVDLGREGSLTGSETSIGAALLAQAESSYSIPASKRPAIRAAKEIAHALAQVPEQDRTRLEGPFWRSRSDLDAQRPAARATGLAGDLIVAADGSLFASIGP